MPKQVWVHYYTAKDASQIDTMSALKCGRVWKHHASIVKGIMASNTENHVLSGLIVTKADTVFHRGLAHQESRLVPNGFCIILQLRPLRGPAPGATRILLCGSRTCSGDRLGGLLDHGGLAWRGLRGRPTQRHRGKRRFCRHRSGRGTDATSERRGEGNAMLAQQVFVNLNMFSKGNARISSEYITIIIKK